MKMLLKKNFIICVLLCIFCSFSSACSKTNYFYFESDVANINVGQSINIFDLKFKTNFSNLDNYTIKSEDSGVVSVEENIITGVSKGSTVITITFNSGIDKVSSSLIVNVKDIDSGNENTNEGQETEDKNEKPDFPPSETGEEENKDNSENSEDSSPDLDTPNAGDGNSQEDSGEDIKDDNINNEDENNSESGDEEEDVIQEGNKEEDNKEDNSENEEGNWNLDQIVDKNALVCYIKNRVLENNSIIYIVTICKSGNNYSDFTFSVLGDNVGVREYSNILTINCDSLSRFTLVIIDNLDGSKIEVEFGK